MRFTALAVAALSLAACSRPAAPTPAEVSASVEELGQMNRDFAAAINAKDGALAASYYSEDAVVIPPGEAEVRGRAAIEAYWKGTIASGGLRDASVETIEAQSSGSLGYEIGRYTLTANGPDGAPVQERGRYLELLKRGPDGKWYSIAGIWNASPQ
jgi:ketosteroid isomerase-like protein